MFYISKKSLTYFKGKKAIKELSMAMKIDADFEQVKDNLDNFRT